MRAVALSRGLSASVDDEDYDLVAKYRWHARPSASGHTFYAARTIWLPSRGSTTQQMHRLISGIDGVDHVDGDGLNNCRVNLRPASGTQQLANQRKSSGTSSQFKGVDWRVARHVWRARIRLGAGRVHIHLGHFSDEEAAARAYDAAARHHFGPFAALNFPTGAERSALHAGQPFG